MDPIFLLLIIPAACVLILLLPFLIGPLIIRDGPGISAHPQFQPVDLEDIRPDQRMLILASAPALASLGFSVAAHAVNMSVPANCLSVISAWTNRATGDAAAVQSSQVFGLGRLLACNEHIQFETRYPDGTTINTLNSASPPVYPDRPEAYVLRCPGVYDTEELYRIHRDFIASVMTPGLLPVLPEAGQELAALCEQDVLDDLRRFADLGYLRFDRQKNTYRNTLKGGIRGAWLSAWPVKPLRKILLLRRTRRTLRSIGHAVAASQLSGLGWREYLPLRTPGTQSDDRARGFAPLVAGADANRTPTRPVTRSGPSASG